MAQPLATARAGRDREQHDKRIRTAESPAAVLAHAMHELAGVIGAISDEQYACQPVGVIPGSIGAHVRHSLDHVEALLTAVHTGEIDYDHRKRGTRIENDRAAAIERLGRIGAELLGTAEAPPYRPISMSARLTASGPAIQVGTTLAREFAYVLSHTIHHNATIAAMARHLGVEVPSQFGYAPSTLAYLQQAAPRP